MISTELLFEENCCACGIRFAMPKSLEQARRRDERSFYCPNGHGQHYANSEEKKLKRQVETLREELRYEQGEVVAQKRRVATEKGKNTRLLKRIESGVCPHCSRSFANLKRHIACKHQGG